MRVLLSHLTLPPPLLPPLGADRATRLLSSLSTTWYNLPPDSTLLSLLAEFAAWSQTAEAEGTEMGCLPWTTAKVYFWERGWEGEFEALGGGREKYGAGDML